LYGYRPAAILLDEPDAHLHVNLQREMLDYFKERAKIQGTQFIIATHAEELIKGVDPVRIVSLLRGEPIRESSTPDVISAMSNISNLEITRIRNSPCIIHVEGDSDERIIRAWSRVLNHESLMATVSFQKMGGGSKEQMKNEADKHFRAITKIIKGAKRIMVFDYDSDETSFHPAEDNEVLFEWKRKNIENYLLVQHAWERAVYQVVGTSDDLFAKPYIDVIRDFFASENLVLPPNRRWTDLDADWFRRVDGKNILFDSRDSLFDKLRNQDPRISVTREIVAGVMKDDEIHNDVRLLFEKIRKIQGSQDFSVEHP
jgi:hypothetical protein